MPRICSRVAFEIVDVHGIFDDVVGELVGLAVREPGLDAAAGEPPGKSSRRGGPRPATGCFDLALRERRSAELAPEEHERVLEQAALLEDP